MRLSNLELVLQKALENEPKPPFARKKLIKNATPAAMRDIISKGAYSFSIASDEAGNVLNSPTATDLTFFNDGYSGSPIQIERKTSPSIDVKNYSMSTTLMAQETVVRDFLKRKGGRARGDGFLSRFNMMRPETMRGYKFQNTDKKSTGNIERFRLRIAEFLTMEDISLRKENGEYVLDKVTIKLSPKAHELYIQFSNMLQVEMQAGRYFSEDKDLASRSAENASRLACLFHVYEHGLDGDIDEVTFDRAATITLSFLFQSKSILDEFSRPQTESDAQLLCCWLLTARTNLGHQASAILVSDIYLNCRPNRLRDKKVLMPAIQYLADRGIVHHVVNPKPAYLTLNYPFFDTPNFSVNSVPVMQQITRQF